MLVVLQSTLSVFLFTFITIIDHGITEKRLHLVDDRGPVNKLDGYKR